MLFFTSSLFAQNPDQQKQENALPVDSLLSKDLPSELILRVDYFSKTLSAGRDFGVEQYSLAPSLTYYHKSGFFGGITGNIYSQSDPPYSLTDFQLGYSNVFKFNENWSYSLSYDRYLFNPDSDGLLKNNAGLFSSYDFGAFNTSLSYSLVFSSQETGHRLNPAVGGYFVIRKVGFIDKITFSPGVSATFGTSNVPFVQLGKKTYALGQDYAYDPVELAAAKEITALKLGADFRKARRKDPTLTASQFLKNSNLPVPTVEDKPVFGLMSWNFSVPVRFKIKHFSLGITYNYVIPVQLSNESYDSLPNQSYFSANMSYTFRK
jgi:hypothetical protein